MPLSSRPEATELNSTGADEPSGPLEIVVLDDDLRDVTRLDGIEVVRLRRQVAGAEAFLNPGDGAQGSDVSQSSAIDTTTLSAIADTIVTAESVLCSGAGNSSALAEHFALRVLELGLRVTWLADAQAQLLAARLLGPSGTLVALSESARSPEVLAVASAAQASGASINSITAAHRTPLTGLADHILRVPDDPTTPRPDWFGSRAIEGAVLHAMHVLVYRHRRRREQSNAALVAAGLDLDRHLSSD